MGLVRRELEVLDDFLPVGASEMVIAYMHQYKIHLKIKRERKTILGDYRPATHSSPHTISVNANLNKYHFLITFVHELAHLVNFIQHGRRVQPHGPEWKTCFAQLLKRFLEKDIFPADIKEALRQSDNNLSATTCSDPKLFKILYKYDDANGKHLVEHLSIGDTFRTESGEVYLIREKRRTRFACEQIHSKKMYFFPGIYEVFKE
ncbi:MAG: SprT-like domain-containing protein [Chitinophagaceae bacterium]|nr:SprT-like domain-containing protein [Chitinophagaceae bacterium]